jgi:hypothetical protein
MESRGDESGIRRRRRRRRATTTGRRSLLLLLALATCCCCWYGESCCSAFRQSSVSPPLLATMRGVSREFLLAFGGGVGDGGRRRKFRSLLPFSFSISQAGLPPPS